MRAPCAAPLPSCTLLASPSLLCLVAHGLGGARAWLLHPPPPLDGAPFFVLVARPHHHHRLLPPFLSPPSSRPHALVGMAGGVGGRRGGVDRWSCASGSVPPVAPTTKGTPLIFCNALAFSSYVGDSGKGVVDHVLWATTSPAAVILAVHVARSLGRPRSSDVTASAGGARI